MKTWIVIPYLLASFISASLLFAAEPMLGKMALPPLGGTPAVWNTCLLFFQTTLLAGYLLAMALGRLEDIIPRVPYGVFLNLLILGYVVQPIQVNMGTGRFGPIVMLLFALLRGSALPLILISATAPLVQHWFAETDHPRARDPYFLYAASNAGSLMALLAYPLWIEPAWSLTVQAALWRRSYVIVALLLWICGSLGRPGGDGFQDRLTSRSSSGRLSPSFRDWLGWIALAAIPSSWLMGVTTFLTTNLAAMPLLWVIPLAIFLIASILAFAESTRPTSRRLSRLFPWTALALVLVLLAGFVHAIWLPLHLVTFLLACLVCNGELARSRPAAGFATSFYLAIAVGGVLGGAFNALAAPALFNGIAEYPLAILCGCLAFPAAKERSSKASPSIRELLNNSILPIALLMCALPLTLRLFDSTESLVGVCLLILASGLGVYATVKVGERPLRFALTVGAVLLAGLGATDPAGTTLLRSRNFYGVVRVTVDREANCRRLLHGGTLHGEQSLDPLLQAEPRTYFTRTGPIGDIFRARQENSSGSSVAVVGLGIGTLAAFGEPGERWTFYELDPTVVRIARDPSLFTYLANCRADAQAPITGDARIRIQDAADGQFSLIVLDAFGADAVPVHLITREAIRLYLTKLAPGGLLVFNITNGYVDLEPVIGRQAEDAGLACRVRRDVRITPEERKLGKLGSIWAVMGRRKSDLRDLVADPKWLPPRIRPGSRPWTDDYSNLASYLLIFYEHDFRNWN